MEVFSGRRHSRRVLLLSDDNRRKQAHHISLEAQSCSCGQRRLLFENSNEPFGAGFELYETRTAYPSEILPAGAKAAGPSPPPTRNHYLVESRTPSR